MADTVTEKVEVTEFLEREAGGRHHQAVMFVELQSACETAYEELRYWDPEDRPAGVLEAIELLKDYEFRV